MTVTLTTRQADALDFIRAFQTEKGFGPTYVEIAVGIGLKPTSKGRIQEIIRGLEERGCLRKPANLARAYEIDDPQGDALFHIQQILAAFREGGPSFIWNDNPAIEAARRFVKRSSA